MAGTYIQGVSKVLSGVYTLIVAAVTAAILGARGVVAYPFTSNWGPVNELTPVTGADEFDNLFNGKATVLTALKIYTHAFVGKPKQVLAYRMALPGAAKGTAVIPDTGAGTSFTLTTLYPSSRSFTAAVSDNVGGGKKVDILEGAVVRASITGTTVAELVAALNKTAYVRATAGTAVLPANTAGVAFTGGADGQAVTATEYSAFLSAVEADGTANALALDGTTDEAILTVAETWVKRVRSEGTYVTWVRGGAAGWDTTPADANTKSKALNHRGIVNVGNGVDGYTAADMAIYVAARVAAVALNRTLTDEELDPTYKAVNKKLLPAERVTAKQAGTLVFVQEYGKLLIDEGVNTLTVPAVGEAEGMAKIRVNNALDQINRDLETFGNEYKKTRSNTPEARQTYAATLETDYFAPLQASEVIQPGYFYEPDPDYHGKTPIYTPKLDEAFFHGDFTPVDSMERIYQKFTVHF